MTVYTVPGTVAADGSADVTAALQAWVNSVPDGTSGSPNILRFGVAATYNTEGPLLVKGRNWLTFDGRGSTFVANTNGVGLPFTFDPYFAQYNWPRKRTRWTAVSCAGVTFEDMVLRGGNPDGGVGDAAYVAAWEAQHGFDLIGCTGTHIEGCDIGYIYGDGVYINGGSDHTVTLNTIHHNGRQGFSVVDGSDVWFTFNTVDEIRRSMVDIEANSDLATMDEVHIEDNIFGDNRLNLFSNHGSSWRISNVYFRRNTKSVGQGFVSVNNVAPAGLRGPYFFEDNEINFGGSPSPGLYFQRCAGVTVTGNTLAMYPGRAMTCVRTYMCDDVTFTGNTTTNELVELDEIVDNVNQAASLVDDFDGALVAARWDATVGGTVSGGKAHLPVVTATRELGSRNGSGRRSIYNSYAFVEAVTMPTAAGTKSASLMVRSDLTTYAQIRWTSSGALVFRNMVAGVPSDTSVTYDPGDHRWWRFRGDNTGALNWETSADGWNWTTQRTVSVTWDLRFVELVLQATSTANTGEVAEFDRFNVLPDPPPDPPPPPSPPPPRPTYVGLVRRP